MESIDNERKEKTCVRILCSRKMLFRKEPCLQWLIGSPAFFPPFTIVSSFRCLHFQTQGDPFSPDYVREADDLKMLLLRGFDIIGVLFINNSINWEENACMAAESSHRMRKLFYGIQGHNDMIGAAADLVTGDIRFFVSRPGKSTNLEPVGTTIYEENPEKFMWDSGCLLRCEMTIKLPIYVPTDKVSEAEERFCSAVDAAAAKLKSPNVSYMVEAAHVTPEEVFKPIVFHYNALDFETDLLEVKLLTNFARESDAETVLCSDFCLKNRPFLAFTSGENADAIQVTVLFNQSGNSLNSFAPIAEYFPASGPAQLLFGSFKLDVLSYASKGLPLASAVSKLIVPGLADQLTAMKKAFLPSLLTQHPQLRSHHFNPPGVLHPITALYELSYGETEMKQVLLRRSIHLRLGLPLDRPLLLIANALTFGVEKGNLGKSSRRNGSDLLKDIHTEVPSSGVSGGLTSLVQGSYEYYHYLHAGFDDSGWGCAYRSLQTIISWFRLEHYTSIDVPSHRDIQQALVDIGDKEPSFLGSREWIGAIELSFVLDKLLGVSCKVINVRSGAELPEKCRELALHFETQGTPVMIGGGVLAYTLLGVDYNEASGDCAFLILDPHYTGNDDLKKIVNGGWCGWKKAIDSKGRNFFLHDKFYNLLLPQRPNMV